MDVGAIRDMVHDSAAGVEIRMIDGTVYRVPHRDYIWFTPVGAAGASGARRFASVFYVQSAGRVRIVNAMLVEHVSALNGRRGRGRRSA